MTPDASSRRTRHPPCSPSRPSEHLTRWRSGSGPRRCGHLTVLNVTAFTARLSTGGTRKPLPVSGPYLLDFWRLNDKVRIRKNPRYWQKG